MTVVAPTRTIRAAVDALLDRVDYRGPGDLDWTVRSGSPLLGYDDAVSCTVTLRLGWIRKGDIATLSFASTYSFRLLEDDELLESFFRDHFRQLVAGLGGAVTVRRLALVP